MHISTIEITNFRGISHLKIEDFKMVNIFLGKNNIGKTTVLEAIFLSLGAGNPIIAIGIDGFRNLIHTQSEDFKFIFHQLNYDHIIEIKTKYHRDEWERNLRITPRFNTTVLSTQNDLRKNLEEISSSASNETNLALGLNLEYSQKKRQSKKEVNLAIIELQGNSFKATPVKSQYHMRGVIVPSNAMYDGLSKRLEKVLINKDEQKIIDFLKPVDNSIQGLTLGSGNLILCDTGFGKRYPINLLGDGVIKLISILLSIYDAKDGVVLVDEFSNGLHYTALRVLWKSILESAKAYNVQVFLTTHDYEALTHLRNVLEEDSFSNFQEDIRSYTLRKLPEAGFKSYQYNYEQLDAAIDQQNEIR